MEDFICKLALNYMKLFDNIFHVFQGYLFILTKTNLEKCSCDRKTLTARENTIDKFFKATLHTFFRCILINVFNCLYNMYVRMSHFSTFTMCVLDNVFIIVRPKFVVLKVII